MAPGSTARTGRGIRGRFATVVLGTAAIAALALALTSPRARAAPSPAGPPLRIGIIGTGHIGGTLATLWAKAGYELTISSRHPQQLVGLARSLGPKGHVGTPREAATFGSVVLISVPYAALPGIGRELRSQLRGKIVIDTGNPYPARDGPMAVTARREGTGVASARYLPGVRLVRAFNAISWIALARQARVHGERAAIPIAGDDPKALAVAARLVRAAGFEPVVVGGLGRAREFDVGTPVYVKLLTASELRAALGLPKSADSGAGAQR
ncbi:MAG: NADPH-dependent F420 reductase [Steroidobacteraceae bacterium]